MKAITYTDYGPPEVLRIRRPRRQIPGSYSRARLSPLAEAHRPVESGERLGAIVITMDSIAEGTARSPQPES
jgi:hypothetical protein